MALCCENAFPIPAKHISDFKLSKSFYGCRMKNEQEFFINSCYQKRILQEYALQFNLQIQNREKEEDYSKLD